MTRFQRSDAVSTDVVIVGAGPTGLTLANLLGGMGVRTLILEKNEGTVQEPRAVSIDDESMRTMQAARLAEAVEAITARGYGSIYRGPSGQAFAKVMPSGTEYGFEKRNAFQQPELEEVLRCGLGRFPNVDARFSTELTSFENLSDRVVAHFTTAGNRRTAVQARYLVGSDGGRSGIRKTLGIALEGGTFEEPWLIVDLETTSNPCRHTEVNCDPRRPCISLPGPGGIRRYEFMLHSHENRQAATDEAFVQQLLGQVGPDRDAPIRRKRVYTFHARTAARWRAGRVFLAGDAAHLTPPFAGQGMNSGIRDAHNLAWKLAEALSAPDPERILDSYEIERKPHAQAMIDLALRMGQVMMPTSRLRAMVVRTGFRLLGLYPPARDYVAQMRYKPKPWFKQGLVWYSHTRAARNLTGRMLPQPIVETPERDRFLLDTQMPDTPVVLLLTRTPDRVLARELLNQFHELGAGIFGVTPEDTNPPLADFPIVRDVSGHLSSGAFADCLDHALLIRRDRYIAAVRPVHLAQELVPLIQELSPGSARAHGAQHSRTSRYGLPADAIHSMNDIG